MKFHNNPFNGAMTYSTGKHRFIAVDHAKSIQIDNNVDVFFQAEDLYIKQGNKEINLTNDQLQMIINIYIKRIKSAKKLTKEVYNTMKKDKIDVYKACNLAYKKLNIK